LANSVEPGVLPDDFGRGELMERLETRLRDEFGTEAAVFMPTGRMAQLTALRIWAERGGNRAIGLHPNSHISAYEGNGYQLAFDLKAVPMGVAGRVPTLADFQSLRAPVAVASIEVPTLLLSCQLPPWDELVAISEHARSSGLPIHCDGARIWEAAEHYGRPVAELSALFDSMYVSVYKGVGAMAGAALLGSTDLVGEVRHRRELLGGNPPTIYPLLVDALAKLDTCRVRIAAYHERALSIATSIGQLAGFWVTPSPPQINTFTVSIAGAPEGLRAANAQVARELGIWLVDVVRPMPVQGLVGFQVVVGDAALVLSDDEITAALMRLRELTSGALLRGA
jgi:threonine aldolase